MSARDYDSTVARITGNLLSGVLRIDTLSIIGHTGLTVDGEQVVRGAVTVARAIVAETRRQASEAATAATHNLSPRPCCDDFKAPSGKGASLKIQFCATCNWHRREHRT